MEGFKGCDGLRHSCIDLMGTRQMPCHPCTPDPKHCDFSLHGTRSSCCSCEQQMRCADPLPWPWPCSQHSPLVTCRLCPEQHMRQLRAHPAWQQSAPLTAAPGHSTSACLLHSHSRSVGRPAAQHGPPPRQPQPTSRQTPATAEVPGAVHASAATTADEERKHIHAARYRQRQLTFQLCGLCIQEGAVVKGTSRHACVLQQQVLFDSTSFTCGCIHRDSMPSPNSTKRPIPLRNGLTCLQRALKTPMPISTTNQLFQLLTSVRASVGVMGMMPNGTNHEATTMQLPMASCAHSRLQHRGGEGRGECM